MNNTFGDLFAVTCFGESHGPVVGVVIDGCPAGLRIEPGEIQAELDRRKPRNEASTTRIEPDRVEFLSGTLDSTTTGAPVTLLVRNTDADSAPYQQSQRLARPGHADYTAFAKYKGYADHRGGGRFSGRLTAAFVMAGGVARKLLTLAGIEVIAHTIAIGPVKSPAHDFATIKETARQDQFGCADKKASRLMSEAILEARESGDSLGGIIEGLALGVPAGLGEPVFDNLDSQMAKALFSIPAVKGVEFGAGFGSSSLRGSANNDPFRMAGGSVRTTTNNAGGVLGGISTGMPLVVRVAIKPTPSIRKAQDSVNLDLLENQSISVKGRHDVCIVPRAVVVVEAMMAVTLVDFCLKSRLIPGVIDGHRKP